MNAIVWGGRILFVCRLSANVFWLDQQIAHGTQVFGLSSCKVLHAVRLKDQADKDESNAADSGRHKDATEHQLGLHVAH